MSCNVVPDKGFFSPEYALEVTILDFEIKLFMSWEKNHCNDKNYIKKKFGLFRSCLQGEAAIEWVIYTVKYKEDFTNCMMDYLEAVAKCTNLGDQVISWLHIKTKPGHM